MAFVAEDGTGLTNANSYVSVAFADSHHEDRGNTRWSTLGTASKQACLVRATDYIDKRFGRRFRGWKQDRAQSLEWPRMDAYDNDGFLLNDEDDVPRQLQKAVAEYALRAALVGVLAPDPLSPVPAQSMDVSSPERSEQAVTGEVKRTRTVVGPIEEDISYVTAAETVAKSLASGAKSTQSSLVNDFVIPEYPEADMWIEELLRSSHSISLSRA